MRAPAPFSFSTTPAIIRGSPYDQYSTVPPPPSAAGDLSGLTAAVVDRRRGCRSRANQIPAAQLNPAAQKLLDLIPLPNQDAPRRTSTPSRPQSTTSTTSTCASCTTSARSRSAGAEEGGGARGAEGAAVAAGAAADRI